MNRRSALKSIILAGVAPFFVPAEHLMRIKPIVVPTLATSQNFCIWRFYKNGALYSEEKIPLDGLTKNGTFNLVDISKPIDAFVHDERPALHATMDPILQLGASPDETNWTATTFTVTPS